GFELRTDEYEGKSQLELILLEIDETNLTAVTRLLDHVIPQAIRTIDAIASATKAKNGWVKARDIAALRGWFTWITVVPGRTARFKWLGGNKVSGQLQATAGMSLSTLVDTLRGERLRQHRQAYQDLALDGNEYEEAGINLGQLMGAYGSAPVMKD